MAPPSTADSRADANQGGEGYVGRLERWRIGTEQTDAFQDDGTPDGKTLAGALERNRQPRLTNV